jgi:hypothetical protein
MILGVRACMLTIRHYVTNTTDSQNAGALGDHMARPPLSARPPTDAAEERTLRRLANARHAPASLIQRAPRRCTSGCTASTPMAWTGWPTCPVRACPGG